MTSEEKLAEAGVLALKLSMNCVAELHRSKRLDPRVAKGMSVAMLDFLEKVDAKSLDAPLINDVRDLAARLRQI